MPKVTLNCVGPDNWEGDLVDHGRTLLVQVRTDLDAPDHCRVSLWVTFGDGKNPCGWGRMHREGAGWEGAAEDTVSRRSWRVSGGLADSMSSGGELSFEPVASRVGK